MAVWSRGNALVLINISYSTLGLVTKQDGPTDWVNSILVVEKKDGSLHICFDLDKANKKEYYHTPSCEKVPAKLSGKKIFTIIDMKNGFGR